MRNFLLIVPGLTAAGYVIWQVMAPTIAAIIGALQ